VSDALDLNDIKRRMEGAIQAFKHDLGGLRTGRASASLLEPITVSAYGSDMPINQVANISVPEPRMLSVSVWDKSMVGAVERAIRDSGLGLNPITDGTTLRIPLPELNEQRRKELVKIAHQYAEQARVAARHVRRDGMDQLKKLEKDGDISQDDSRVLSEKVQKLTDETISELDKMLAVKEAEIMQV
jgi:ribosome recycling factor